MMSLLAQIAATVLSIFVSVVAAYYVFLISSKANVENQIQGEGFEIVRTVRSAPIRNVLSGYVDIFLMETYKTNNPDKATSAIYKLIAANMVFGAPINPESAKRLRDLAEKGNHPGPVFGRLAVWLIQTALYSLAPDHSLSPLGIPRSAGEVMPAELPPEERARFPYGLVGIEQWLQDFVNVRDAVRTLTMNPTSHIFIADMKPAFVADMQKFIEKFTETFGQSPWTEQFKRSDYHKWFDDMGRCVETLSLHHARVESLLLLRDRYAPERSLPHLNWMIFVSILLAVLGVFLPVSLVGLRLEAAVPAPANLALAIIVVGLFAAGAVMFAIDLRAPEDRLLRYFVPLREALQSDEKRKDLISFDVGLLNEVLSPDKTLPLRRSTRDALTEYRTALLANNSAAERLAAIVADRLRAVLPTNLAPPAPSGAGYAMGVFDPFYTDVTGRFRRGGRNISVESRRGPVSSVLIAFFLPDTPAVQEQVIRAIQETYANLRTIPEYGAYEKARAKLEASRRKVLGVLDDAIGRSRIER